MVINKAFFISKKKNQKVVSVQLFGPFCLRVLSAINLKSKVLFNTLCKNFYLKTQILTAEIKKLVSICSS